jgi:large subunit ribosomal protein L9
MEIILKQDITGVGYKNDLLNVKDGFARNYLIPKGFAVIATPSSKKALAELNKQQAFRQEKIKTEAEAVAQVLEGSELNIAVKASSNGKIFGSVTNVMIANAIQDQKNLEVDRKTITFKEDTIKEVGTYKASIRLHKEVNVELTLNVEAE